MHLKVFGWIPEAIAKVHGEKRRRKWRPGTSYQKSALEQEAV